MASRMICDVCRLLDGDLEPKDCEYCSFCNAWICKEDLHKYPRRLRAWKAKKDEEKARGR